MIEGIVASVSALRATQRRVSQTAHNIANVSTPGFLPRRVGQADMAQGGVRVVGQTALPQGPLMASESSLDLGINGPGFFVLNQPDGGQIYTRAGNFMLDSQGRMVDPLGRTLAPGITIPAGAAQIVVSPQGQIQALDQTGTVISQGQLLTASFGNVGGLESVGGNAFAATAASGPPVLQQPGADGHGAIVSGVLQASGTELARKMVNLITDQRVFEANAMVVRTHDELLGSILDIKS